MILEQQSLIRVFGKMSVFNNIQQEIVTYYQGCYQKAQSDYHSAYDISRYALRQIVSGSNYAGRYYGMIHATTADKRQFESLIALCESSVGKAALKPGQSPDR